MLVNHSGTVGDTPLSSSPAIPEQRNTTRYATYQRTAVRTSLNTSPERGENPPQADPAGLEEAAQWDHRQRRSQQDGDLADEQEPAKFRVREKTTIAASRIAKYTSGTQPTGDPNAR